MGIYDFLLTSFTGKFQYVPFTYIFTKDHEPETLNETVDFDRVRSKFLCMPYKRQFTFTDDTMASFVRTLT